MVKGCTNLASHKIGEYNVYDPDAQTKECIRFDMRHEYTTYLCDEHFDNIMAREEKHGLPDTRKFE